MPTRIIYFGTSAFAVPPLLRLLAEPERFAVVAVVSQPDKPVGRKAVLTPTPVSATALERDLPLLRYASLKTDEAATELAAHGADVFVTAAYGNIVPQRLLDIPRVAAVNLHGSVLPLYRGASPIQAAILAGDAATGVSLMQMDAQMDHGPVYAVAEVPIAADDTFTALEAKLAEAAAELLAARLPSIVEGALQGVEQDHAQATHAALIRKEDGRADPARESAAELERKLRAYTPWPGLTCSWGRGADTLSVKILHATVADAPLLAPGAHGVTPDGYPALGTREGVLVLRTVQPPGKRPMDGRDFVRGYGWEG